MMEGSSLRMMVGMYSALGTLEEMSWGHRSGSGKAWPPRSPGAAGAPVGQPTRSSRDEETPRQPPGEPHETPPHPAGQPAVAASLPGRQSSS